jgi:hypothetical protein
VLLASLAVIGSLVQQSDAARPVPTPGRKLSQLLPTPDPGLSPAVPEFPPVLPTVGAGFMVAPCTIYVDLQAADQHRTNIAAAPD